MGFNGQVSYDGMMMDDRVEVIGDVKETIFVDSLCILVLVVAFLYDLNGYLLQLPFFLQFFFLKDHFTVFGLVYEVFVC